MKPNLDDLESALKRHLVAKNRADREFNILKIMVAVNFVLTLIILALVLT